MKEEYEHYVTFHSVLHSEKPSREDRSSPDPYAAYGLGACATPLQPSQVEDLAWHVQTTQCFTEEVHSSVCAFIIRV